MAPDIEELINKVNTLTLDKNRLKQKLKHLTQNGNITSDLRDSSGSLSQSPGNNNNNHHHHSHIQNQNSSDSLYDSGKSSINNRNPVTTNKRPSAGDSLVASQTSPKIDSPANVIAGVECATSCEDDLLYMNDLYKKRLDEYNEQWDYIQSKCTALLSELSALQNNYAMLKKEKLDLEEKLKLKDDDYDTIKGELQTVVLNYETQLSAMSEHLSMIANKSDC